MSDDKTPLTGGFVLLVGAACLLTLFWMLRSGPVPAGAWFVTGLLWVCGTALRLKEMGGLR